MATQPSDSSKHKPQRTLADELAVIAQRAQAFTNASGAAIALSEGVTDEIVCKARSGSSAPEVGAVLRVDGTFTGVCIQTGRELRCDDTETDTRVDTVAVRALGIRSMVITPIRDENKAVGVLAVFASTPHAFTITHVAVLKTMADQISGLIQKDRRAREEGLHPEPPVSMGKLPVTPAPGPVAVKPIAPISVPIPVRPPSPKVEPIRPLELAAEVAAPVPFPKREESNPELKQEPVLKTNFGTFDAMSPAEGKFGGSKFVIYGLLALVLAGAGGTWFYMRARRAQGNPPQTAQSTLNVSPAPSAAPNAGDTSAGVSTSAAGGAAPATQTSPATLTVSQPNTRPAQIERADVRRTASQEKPSPAQAAPTPAEPAPIEVSGGSSKIAANIQQQQQQQQQQAPDVAPSIAVGGSSPSALSTLARPVNATAPAASLAQSELVDVKLIHGPPPVYPAIARARRVTGLVTVKVKVGRDGRVASAQFVSGPQIFKDAALEAVRQWQYKPATLDGKTIEQETEIKLKFLP